MKHKFYHITASSKNIEIDAIVSEKDMPKTIKGIKSFHENTILKTCGNPPNYFHWRKKENWKLKTHEQKLIVKICPFIQIQNSSLESHIQNG